MNTITKKFIKYVSFNVLGMVGMSIYILSDTFFMSYALHSDGITALNFALPVYSLIFALSLMVGIGGATVYKLISTNKEQEKANKIYTLTIFLGISIGIIFMLLGIFFSREITVLFGAKDYIIPMTQEYIKTIMIFAPAFMLNSIYQAFIRNDNNPKLPMLAMIIGSTSNIILDLIFIFILKMGMFGAAISTCIAPIISLIILSRHFIKKKNTFHFSRKFLSIKDAFNICKLGISSFITEISSGIVMLVFNIIILKINGVIGVAAYGIITNISLVALIIFSGIGQGIQPLASTAKSENNKTDLSRILKLGIFTTITFSIIIYIASLLFIDGIISVFNSEKSVELYNIAKEGIRIFFAGFIFASINIVLSSFYSAVDSPKKAFIISVLRGFLLIIPLAYIMTKILGMTGIWLSFVLTELIVTIISIIIGKKKPAKKSLLQN